MRISERGQVTIPKNLRDQFRLTRDTPIEFIARDGRLEIVRKPKQRKQAIENLYGRKEFGRSTDELMQLLRE